MLSDLERRLERGLAQHREPGADVEERLRVAVLSALPVPRFSTRQWLATRLRLRRRIGPLVLVGALLVGGGALAATVLQWGPSSSGRVGIFVSTKAAQHFADTPALAGAPWLSGGAPQTIAQVPPRPSLIFPAGTTYPEAVQSFYDAVSQDGTLPPGTHLGLPLPAGRVVSLTTGGSAGVALDLRAPFGYWVPSGVILGPQIAGVSAQAVWPQTTGPDAELGTVLPTGVRVLAPQLLACQMLRSGRPGPACSLSASAPGARYVAGVTRVPDLRGTRLPDALDLIEHDRLGLAFDAGYFPAYSQGAIDQAIASGQMDRGGTGSLITLAEFTRQGYGAPGLYRPATGRAGIRLTASENAAPGTVVAQYPPVGTEVPRGTPVVLAAASDDCLLHPFSAGPWDCVPGSAAAALSVPALSGPLPWLTTKPSGARFRIWEVPTRPSLVFPSGTTYLQAVRALLVAVVGSGQLPREALLGPPLPRGVVVSFPSGRGRGLALDLRAPFGYDPATGQIDQPSTAPISGIAAGALRAAIRSGRVVLLPPVLPGLYLMLPVAAGCQVERDGVLAPGCHRSP